MDRSDLKVGATFRCGGTTNIWRILAVKDDTVTVERINHTPQGPFVWNCRSALAQGVLVSSPMQ